MFEDDPNAQSYDTNGKAFFQETQIPIANETLLTEEYRFCGGFSRRAVEQREAKKKRPKPCMPVLTAI